MRFNAGVIRSWAMGIAGVMLGGTCAAGDWVAIPRHAVRGGEAGGFEMERGETRVAPFVEYLNRAGVADYPETAQIRRMPGGGYAARRGTGRQAVAEVKAEEAEAYARWISRETGRTVRLPTEAEWEAAARGGVDGAPFPWGWGGEPAELARFDAGGPAPRGGRFPANGFGLYDMAGNLYEWCAPEASSPPDRRLAKGGSWAERDPDLLRVDRRQPFPADYRGRDVGFRLLREGLGK